MTAIALEPIFRPKLIRPVIWHPSRFGVEMVRDLLDKLDMRLLDRYWRAGTEREQMQILMMAGSDGNFLSAKIAGLVDGKTAYAGEATYYIKLFTAALDDTATGATAGIATYTSYADLALTNNTTIFPAGSGTTTTTNTWPGDALKSWPTSTGGSSTIVDILKANGNAGTSADKNCGWATVTSQLISSGDTPQLAQNAISQIRD